MEWNGLLYSTVPNRIFTFFIASVAEGRADTEHGAVWVARIGVPVDLLCFAAHDRRRRERVVRRFRARGLVWAFTTRGSQDTQPRTTHVIGI